MRVYVNKNKKIILAPEVFEKYGGVSDETIQIKDGEFTAEIEKEVNEAMQEIIDRWQPIFDEFQLKPYLLKSKDKSKVLMISKRC